MLVKNLSEVWQPLGRDGIDPGEIKEVSDAVAFGPRAQSLSKDLGGPLQIPYIPEPVVEEVEKVKQDPVPEPEPAPKEEPVKEEVKEPPKLAEKAKKKGK